MASLFSPLRLGGITLPNRIIMAPLTRCRATPGTFVAVRFLRHARRRAQAPPPRRSVFRGTRARRAQAPPPRSGAIQTPNPNPAGETQPPQNDMMAKHYADRATAGLLIAEATVISEEARGFPNTPGCYNAAQVRLLACTRARPHSSALCSYAPATPQPSPGGGLAPRHRRRPRRGRAHLPAAVAPGAHGLKGAQRGR